MNLLVIIDADAAINDCADITRRTTSHGRIGVKSIDADAAINDRADITRRTTSHGRIGVKSADGEPISRDEAMRILAPGGVLFILGGDHPSITTKARPETIDDWTHYLYGPDNNAVSKDTEVGPPQHIQWICGPRFSRTHDHLASMSAMVSAGGRVFYIVDEAPAAFAGATARWKLVARDAFNGVLLWKHDIDPWEYHLRDFRSGPADIARRLVAVGDRVYVTLGYGAPVTALDAATGEILQNYAGTEDATEILVDGGALLIAAGERDDSWRYGEAKEIVSQTDYVPPFEDVTPPTHEMRVMAVDAASGEILWRNAESYAKTLMPATLTSSDGCVYFETPEMIVCLDASNGRPVWTFPRPLQRLRLAWSSPTLVVHDGVVFSADRRAASAEGDVLWMPSGGYHDYIRGPDVQGELIALDAATGERLWSCEAYEGFNSAVDVFIADGVLWTGNYAWGDGPGITQGRDPIGGQVVRTRPSDLEFLPRIGHARCHRAKATEKYLILGRRGVEWIDVKTGEMIANRFIRGMCQYGVMPANGLLYLPPHSCACSTNDMLKYGFMALAPEQGDDGASDLPRLERGGAYDEAISSSATPGDWPTYRGSAGRGGLTTTSAPTDLSATWNVLLEGELTSPVVAEGVLLAARINAHEVHALDTETGRTLWTFTTGARIDSPPTIDSGRAIFGSNDGHVYCLRLSDGEMIWRFRATPSERQIMVDGQLESIWPVSGSVLVLDHVVYFSAGRTSYLDGGMAIFKLDAATGETLASIDLNVDKEIRDAGIAGHGFLPDVLSTDGESIFMRSVRFDLNLVRQSEDVPHLWSSVGFLDHDWWHRTYWQFGVDMRSGWSGWAKSGQSRPAGRILVTDGSRVYGYGRDQYDTPGAHVGVDADGVWGPIAREQGRWTYLHLFGKTIDPRSPEEQRREEPLAVVDDDWSQRTPIIGRAMVLAGDSLLLAGPANPLSDVPHEPAGSDPLVEAIEATQGGRLLIFSTKDGHILAEHELQSPPVFDSMAVAGGCVYLATLDGRIVCLGPKLHAPNTPCFNFKEQTTNHD